LRKTQLLALTALFVTALYLLIIASNQSEPTLTLVGDLSFVIVSLCAFLATLLVWKKIPHSFTQEKNAWLLTSIAFFLFMVGDALWAYAELIQKTEVPVGGLPDVSWTSAYLIWIAACTLVRKDVFDPNPRKKFIFAACATLAAVWPLLHIPAIRAEGAYHLFNVLYVSYDLLLLGLMLPLFLALLPNINRLSTPWLLFSVAVGTRIIFDILFAASVAANTYATGHPIDLLYLISYIIITFAADAKRRLFP